MMGKAASVIIVSLVFLAGLGIMRLSIMDPNCTKILQGHTQQQTVQTGTAETIEGLQVEVARLHEERRMLQDVLIANQLSFPGFTPANKPRLQHQQHGPTPQQSLQRDAEPDKNKQLQQNESVSVLGADIPTHPPRATALSLPQLLIPAEQLRNRPTSRVEVPQGLMTRRGWEGVPVVIKKYKLMFFLISKNACQQFKQLFRRMLGLRDWTTFKPQDHFWKSNGITFLDQFSVQEATMMMNSPEWTRAIFLRDPQQRFTSAYADKIYRAKGKTPFYRRQPYTPFDKFVRSCVSKGGFCRTDHHFAPQSNIFPGIENIIPAINFWGRFENVEADAKAMLLQVGANAWELFGASGWGENGDESLFQTQNHPTHASSSAQIFSDNVELAPLILAHMKKDYEVFRDVIKWNVVK